MQKIELRLYCSVCGNILEVTQPAAILNDFTVLVVPCKTCTAQQKMHPTKNGRGKSDKVSTPAVFGG